MIYRRATPQDAEAIGAVHVRAWRETYEGLMPAGMLARLDPVRRAAEWRRGLERGAPVALAFDESALCGFAAWGARRDTALAAEGEIFTIYVLDAAQRRGIGRQLMAMAAAGMTELGHGSAGLWVFDGNGGARAFYERLGGRAGLRQDAIIDGVTVTEIAYVWQDLARLG